MTSRTLRGRKIALLGTAAALTAAMVIPAAVGAQDENAMVRVLHGAGDAPAVDIYADGGLIGEGLAYTEITDYLEVPGGTYQIQVVPSGATLEEGPIVIDAPLTFESGTMTTVAATGSLADGIIPQVLADAPAPTSETAQVRVVHFSDDAPAVDIAPDGATLSSRASNSRTTPATSTSRAAPTTSRSDLPARPTSPSTSPRSPLTDGVSYTVFAVGGLADGSFTVVPAVDAGVAGVRVGHFSADAPNVDVYANGSAILDGRGLRRPLRLPLRACRYLPDPGRSDRCLARRGPRRHRRRADLRRRHPDDRRGHQRARQHHPGRHHRQACQPGAEGAKVRVVHLSANAPKVDVAPDGSGKDDAIFKNLKFGEAKGYKNVPAGEIDLDIRRRWQEGGRLRHPRPSPSKTARPTAPSPSASSPTPST